MSMPCPCLSETIRSDRVLARSISHGDQIIHRRTPSQDQTCGQGIAHMKGVGGLNGWRWIFILVGFVLSPLGLLGGI